MSVETTTVYLCESCNEISEDTGGPVYECGSCGEISPERRCGECNKFKAKLSDNGCSICEAGEVTKGEGIECECHNEWHLVAL